MLLGATINCRAVILPANVQQREDLASWQIRLLILVWDFLTEKALLLLQVTWNPNTIYSNDLFNSWAEIHNINRVGWEWISRAMILQILLMCCVLEQKPRRAWSLSPMLWDVHECCWMWRHLVPNLSSLRLPNTESRDTETLLKIIGFADVKPIYWLL